MHSDYMQPLCDAHDGRLYCYYRTRGVVLNTEKNELFSCEAAGYDTASSGFSTTVPVLGEPAVPLRRYLSDNRIRTERGCGPTTWPPSTTCPRRWRKPPIRR